MKLDKFIDSEYDTYVEILRSLFNHQGDISKRLLIAEASGVSERNLELKIKFLNESLLLKILQRDIKIQNNTITLEIPNGMAFDYIITYFVRRSFLFRLVEFSSLKSEPTAIETLLLTFNMSRATYFRKLRKINMLLSHFYLKIKSGMLIGDYTQKLSFLFELKWSTLSIDHYLEDNLHLRRLLTIVGAKHTTNNLAKTSVFMRVLINVDATTCLDLKSSELLRKIVPVEFGRQLRLLQGNIKELIDDQDFLISRVIFIFLICLVCKNDSELVRKWGEFNKTQSTSIYRATREVFLKMNGGYGDDKSPYFKQLLLLHTLFIFKVNGIDVNDHVEGIDIVDNWFGLNVFRKLSTVLHPIFQSHEYASIFDCHSINWLLRYYSIFFIVHLSENPKHIKVGVYSGKSLLLSEFLLTTVKQISPLNVDVQIIDDFNQQIGTKYDLVVSDVLTYNPVIEGNAYQVAFYNSALDYRRLRGLINDIILSRLL